MKKDQILDKIKSDLEKETPDILSKIDLSKIEIKPKEIKEKSNFNFRPRLIFAPLMVIMVLLITLLPNLLNEGELRQTLTTQITEKEEIILTQAKTAIHLIETQTQGLSSGFLRRSMALENKEEYVDIFHKYLGFTEELVEPKTTLIKEINQTKKGLYPKSKYPYKLTISNTTSLNQVEEYVFYYQNNLEIDEDETEEEMYGYLLFNSFSYYFEAEREVEGNDSEFEIKIYMNKEKTNYIEVNFEVEEDETEFEYIIYENKKEKENITIKKEEDMLEIKIYQNFKTYEFWVKVLTREHYLIEYKDKESSGIIELNILLSGYNYLIDGKLITKNWLFYNSLFFRHEKSLKIW